jgi:hypothetical protein
MWLESLPGGAGLDVSLSSRQRELEDEAQELTREQVEAGEDAWVAGAIERYRLSPLGLTGDPTVEDSGVDLNIVLIIPFEGDPHLWRNDPRDPEERFADDARRPFQGHIDAHEKELRVVLRRKGEERQPRELIKKRLDEVRWWVERSRRAVEESNATLDGRLRTAFRARKSEFEQYRAFIDDAGLPVRKRSDAPPVFRENPVARKATPAHGTTSVAAGEAATQPVLSDKYYDHIITVIRAAGHAMTRAPATYEDWTEEERRNALLLILNTHYEGKAQAEAFNGKGKTDILIRSGDMNVFIAECAYWKGPQSVENKVSQLLGYATWHDTKLALVVFIRQSGITKLVASGRAALDAHPRVSAVSATGEDNEFRCKVNLAGDADRTADLHVFFIPTPAAC